MCKHLHETKNKIRMVTANFENGLFKFSGGGLEFEVTVEGVVRNVVSDGVSSQVVVSGIADVVLGFIDAVLGRGFKIKRAKLESFNTGSVWVKAGRFDILVGADGYIEMGVSGLKFVVTKFEVVVEFVDGDVVKNFVEDGQYEGAVLMVGMRHRLVALGADLICVVNGDELVVKTRFGNEFARFTPWGCELYFVIGCGVIQNGDNIYKWVYNSVVENWGKIKVEGDVVKVGLIEIYLLGNWEVRQVYYDGDIKIWVDDNDVMMRKGDRVLISANVSDGVLSWLNKIIKKLKDK